MAKKFCRSGGSCSAFGCSMRRRTNLLSTIRMFTFPKDRLRRHQWRMAIRRKDWKPTDSSVVCSRHFVEGKPSQDPHHPDYIPSIFNFNASPVHEGQKKFERNAKCRRSDSNTRQTSSDHTSNSNETNANSNEEHHTTANSQPVYLDAFDQASFTQSAIPIPNPIEVLVVPTISLPMRTLKCLRPAPRGRQAVCVGSTISLEKEIGTQTDVCGNVIEELQQENIALKKKICELESENSVMRKGLVLIKIPFAAKR